MIRGDRFICGAEKSVQCSLCASVLLSLLSLVNYISNLLYNVCWFRKQALDFFFTVFQTDWI